MQRVEEVWAYGVSVYSDQINMGRMLELSSNPAVDTDLISFQFV